MKYKNVLAAITIALSLGIAADASAFGLPKVPGLDKFTGAGAGAGAGSDKSMDGVMVQQESLVKTYQSSLGDIISAQALMFEAYDMKKGAAELRAEADALSKGAVDKKQIEKSTTLSKKMNQEINTKMAEEKALTDEGRKKYQQALLPYATGVAKMMKLAPEFQNFLQSAVAQFNSAPLMEKMKVKKKLDVGMYLAKAAPGYLANVTSTTKKLVTYAKRQGVSKQATDNAFAALGNLD